MIKFTNSVKTDAATPDKIASSFKLLGKKPTQITENNNQLIDVLRQEAGEEVLNFITGNVSLLKYQETILFSSKHTNLYEHVNFNNIHTIINLQEVNRHEKINSFFRAINTLLPDSGMYIGCVETYDIRRTKMNKRFGKSLTKVLWLFDFVVNRVMPRVAGFRKLYYELTKNRYRVLSMAEALGRLVYSGFEIIEFKEIGDKIYFSAIKVKEPRYDTNVSYGPFFPMRRVGKNGKIIARYS